MNNPRVGIATLVKKEDKILLGYRKSKLGQNSWGLPGGKLDFGEELKDCAVRELKEETNLIANTDDLILLGVSNAVFDDETHYITVIYEVSKYSGELKIMEPDKCESWEWMTYDDLPVNLFLPLKNFFIDQKIIKKVE